MAIKTRIEVDTSQVKKGLNDVRHDVKKTLDSANTQSSSSSSSTKFSNITDTVKNVASIFGTWGKIIAGVIAVASFAFVKIKKLVNSFTSSLDGIAKSAKSVEMTGEAYMSLQHACNRAGLEMDKVLALITKIDYALIHSQEGEKKYRDAFYDIGLSWRELERLTPEKRLMAINDALTKIKANGGHIPSSLFDVFGRKDMQTLNKMVAEKGFNKYIAEASAMGFTIDDKTLSLAEAYQDAIGDGNEKIQKMVSDLKATKKVTEELVEITEEINNNLGNGTGTVSKEFSDQFIGIGNVALKALFNIKDLNDETKKTVLKNMLNNGISVENSFGRVSELIDESEIDALTSEALNDYYLQTILNFKRHGKDIDPVQLEGIYSSLDSLGMLGKNGFDPNDRKTWIKEKKNKKQLTPEEIARERASDDAEYLDKSLTANLNALNNQVEAVNKFVNIEDRILEIEKKRGVALDDLEKKQLRMNAALNNQKILEEQLKKLKEGAETEQSNWYADMLGTMGVDSRTVKDYFDSLKTATGEDKGSEDAMNMALLYQYAKDITSFSPNADPMIEQDFNESDAEYMNRFNAMVEQGVLDPTDFASKLGTFAPSMLHELFQGVANNIKQGKIYNAISSKDAQAASATAVKFSQYAQTTSGVIDPNLLQYARDENGNFTSTRLDFTSSDYDMQSQIYDSYTDAINAIKEGVQDKMAEVQDLRSKIEDIKKDTEGDPQRNAQKIQQLLNQINMIEMSFLDPAYGMIDELERDQAHYAAGKFNAQANKNLFEASTRELISNNMKLQNSIQSSANENDANKAKYFGDQRTVDDYEKINIAKREGLNLDRQTLGMYANQLNLLLALEKKAQQINLLNNLRDKNFGVMTSALTSAGQGQMAAILTARKDATNTAGRQLTLDEVQLVDRLASLSFNLQNISKPQMKNDIVKTNELAQRGGFAGSVRVERADNRKELLAYQIKIYDALRESNRLQAMIDAKL